MSYLDVDPDAVAAAGRNTAATAEDWAAWAVGTETLLRDTAGRAHSGRVSAAFEDYLSGINPSLYGLAAQARNQGGKAAGAAGAIVDSDAEAATELGRTGHDMAADRSVLRRPVTG